MTDKLSPKIDPYTEADNVLEFPRQQIALPAEKAKSLSITECISRNELVSIKALTGYVAYNKNVPEKVVSAYVQSEFKVADIADLRRNDFERVIQFLVDLRADLLIN